MNRRRFAPNIAALYGTAAAAVPRLVSGTASSNFDASHQFQPNATDRNTTTFHTSASIGAGGTWYVDLTFDNPTQLQQVKVMARDSGLGAGLTPGRFRRYYKDNAGDAWTLDGQGYVATPGYPLASVADNAILPFTFAITVGSHKYWRLEADTNANGAAWASDAGFCSMVEMYGYDTTGGTDMFA